MAAPAGPNADVQRDGLTKIIATAKTICRLNSEFGPLLRSKWSGSLPILALLTALDALCPLLQPASDAQFDYVVGGDNEQIDNDGGQLYIGRLPGATDPTP